jgi:hypothetical protein
LDTNPALTAVRGFRSRNPIISLKYPDHPRQKEVMRNFIAYMNLLWYMYFIRFRHG